jgi:hypothetical protein
MYSVFWDTGHVHFLFITKISERFFWIACSRLPRTFCSTCRFAYVPPQYNFDSCITHEKSAIPMTVALAFEPNQLSSNRFVLQLVKWVKVEKEVGYEVWRIIAHLTSILTNQAKIGSCIPRFRCYSDDCPHPVSKYFLWLKGCHTACSRSHRNYVHLFYYLGLDLDVGFC